MLIAIEGIDASGKHTQAALLHDAATNAGLSAALLSFPRYGQTLFAASVADYLNGRFGDLAAVPPQFAALLYAGDRFETRATIAHLLATHDLLICDRYVASNLAYQAARLDPPDQPQLLSWIATVEHDIFALPRADLTFFLDVPVATAAQMLLHKDERTYTKDAADLHERDRTYLARCRTVYLSLASANVGSAWHVEPCVLDDGTLRAPLDIHDGLWRTVRAALADPGHVATTLAQDPEPRPAGQTTPPRH